MKKRILSIVLAVLMLVSVLPISALAADANPTQPESNIRAEKKAEWVEGRESEGIAKVTIKVSGKAPEESTVTEPTDIVLVIDRSLSMDEHATRNDRDDKMTQAKAAAKQFAQKMLESDKVRIAVVMYTKTAQTVSKSSQDAFSNSYQTVESRINSITTKGVPSQNSGTNTQAGIHAARELLKNSTADNKIMIVLSDGQPNYSFPFVANADYIGCERWFESVCKAEGPRGGYITNIGSFTVDYNHYIVESGGDGAKFNLEYGNARITVKCREHGTTTENFDYGVYNGSTYNGNTGRTDHSVATIWEAGQAKNDGVEIYSIGFGIGRNQNAIKTMQGIASAETKDHYFSAGVTANDIQTVFNSIAKQVSKYVAYNPTVIDTISNEFEYYTDATLTASVGEGDTITPNGQTVTWDLAAQQLDTTEHTLTFYVKYKNIDNPAAPGTNLPTNNGAQLKYAKEADKDPTETQEIADASVESLSKTVSYQVSGQAPSGYKKPDDAYVWAGRPYTVEEAPKSQTTDEGTYTFEGWKKDTETVTELTVNADITLTGEWKFEAKPTTKTITVTKVWDKDVPKDKKIPVQVNLVRNDILQSGDGAEFILKESNEWTVTLAGLQAKDARGNEIAYSFREYKIGDFFVNSQTNAAIDQVGNGDGSFYSVGRYEADVTGSEADGFTITNTYVPYQHNHKVEYEFVGEEKPNNVTEPADATDLYYGQMITLATVTEQAGWTFNGWYEKQENISDATKKLSGLYEVKEDAILYGEWTKNTPTTTTINVTKQWGEGVTEAQKQEVTVRLLDKDGVSKWTDIVLDEDNEWKGTFTVDDADAEYSVIESKIGNAWFYDVSGGGREAIDGDTTWVYTVTGNKTDGFTITNSIKKGEQPPVGEVSVSYEYKKDDWNVDDYADIPADDLAAIKEKYPLPENTTVATGDSISAPNTPEEGNKVTVANGEWEFVKWDVEEFKDLAHDAVFKGLWKFTAKEPEETIDITVHKSWAGLRWGYDIKEPENITIELRQNGTKVEEADVKQTERWTYTFENLPKYESDGTTEINYSVIETKVDGDENLYAFESRNDVIGTWEPKVERGATDGIDFEITNTFKPSTPEPEDHEFTAHIVKRFENKSGKSPKATFTFIAALKDGTEVGSETISFSKGDVDAGDFETKDVTMNVTLTDDEYNNLETDKYGPYLWIYEEDGDVNGVKYDTEPQKAYIIEAKPWSLELDEDGALTLSAPNPTALLSRQGETFASYFAFTNTYKKPGEKGETIKSGPQLNRDDHVAYIMGYPDGTVQPEGEITRAEACTIFFRLLTDSSRDYYFARTNDYSDVNAGDWFNNAISTLSNAGIVTGYNDGTFRPNQPITRGEMAKIIANFANLKSSGKTFTDLAGHWSKTYVELAAGNGWIAGYPDGSFRPDQKITRAETVTMINRVLDRVPAKESRLLSRSIMLTFPDNNPGDWYYIAIQEASNSHEYQRSVYEAAGDEMWTKLIENVDWTKLEK